MPATRRAGRALNGFEKFTGITLAKSKNGAVGPIELS
jgi:hypothetical protein